MSQTFTHRRNIHIPESLPAVVFSPQRDRHSDFYVLFDAGPEFPRRRRPSSWKQSGKNGAGRNVQVDEFTARPFSSIWKLLAVMNRDDGL